jgi:hypothetical protein
MSHHYSGPNVEFPRGDARLDFTDLYAFPNPQGAGRSILIMNFHPSFGIKPPGPTTAEPLAPDALYELRIDTDGDTVADLTYQLRVTPANAGGQTATLRRFEGGRAGGTGEGGQVIIDAIPVSTGPQPSVREGADHRIFVGWRSDPFFFDVEGVLNQFQFTRHDYFADKDVCGVVLDLPNSALGPKEVGLWVRTLIRDGVAGTSWVQADRGARPSQTPFLTGEHNDAYRAGEPAGDVRFVPVFAHALEHTGGYSPEEATRTAKTLLPDLLRFDPKRPASFPNNGRALTDDVSDWFLAVLTNGKVPTDGVGAHGDLLTDFPYLGPPHGTR